MEEAPRDPLRIPHNGLSQVLSKRFPSEDYQILHYLCTFIYTIYKIYLH